MEIVNQVLYPFPSYSFDFRNQINNVSDELNTNIKLNPMNNPVFNKDSVQFNGNGQYMKSSDKLPIGNNGDFSVEFYVNYTPSGSNNTRTIFQLISEENNSFNIELSNMNQTYSEIRLSNGSVWKGNLPETTLTYKTNNSSPNAEDYSPGTPLTTAILPNTLVHYVLTISNNKVILYRNGSSYFEKNGNNLSVKNLNRYIYIAKGMKESSLSSNMKMYFFRIFNKAISPDNITKLYQKRDTMNLFRNCSPATYANAVNQKISDFDLWGVNGNDNIFKFGDDQNSWKQIARSLKNVSSSGKDYIWGANKNDDIFTCVKPCDDGKWTHVPGKLKQVSADDEYVWGVNSGNYIFRKKVNNSDNWKNISGNLNNISSTCKDYLWGTNTLQQIFKCKKPCDTGQWEIVNGRLRQVSGGQNDVWGVNSNNQLYKRPVDGSGNWEEIGGGKFKWVSGANEDFIYAIDTEDKIYKCAQPCDNKSGNWMVIPGALKQLDASKNIKNNKVDSLNQPTKFKIQTKVQNYPDKSISDTDKNEIENNSKNEIENNLLSAISNINSNEINFPIKKNDLGLNYNMNFTSREFFQNQNNETLNMANIQDKIKELEEKKNVQSNQLKEISNKEKLNSKYSTLLKISQDRNGFKRKIIYSLIASISFVFIIILLMFVFYTRKLV